MEPWKVSWRERISYANGHTPSVWRMVGRVLGVLLVSVFTFAIAVAAGVPGILNYEWVFIAGTSIAIVLGGAYDWIYRLLTAPQGILAIRVEQAAPHLVAVENPVRLLAKPSWNERPMRVLVGVQNDGDTDDFKATIEDSASLSLGFGPARQLPWIESDEEFQTILGNGGVEFFEVAQFATRVEGPERAWLHVVLPFGHKKWLPMTEDEDAEGVMSASWEARLSVRARTGSTHAVATLYFLGQRTHFGNAGYIEVRIEQDGASTPSAASISISYNKDGGLKMHGGRPWQDHEFHVNFADELATPTPDLVPLDDDDEAPPTTSGSDT